MLLHSAGSPKEGRIAGGTTCNGKRGNTVIRELMGYTLKVGIVTVVRANGSSLELQWI